MRAAYRRQSGVRPRASEPCQDDTWRLSKLSDAGKIAPHRREARASQGANWPVIGILAAAHAAVVGALLATGAITVQSSERPPIIVEMKAVPELAPEQPPAPPEFSLEPVEPQITAPEVLVETPPPPVVSLVASPSLPSPSRVVVPTNSEGLGSAPVTPPDFEADYLNNPPPRYPPLSRRAREEGEVMLKVLVTPEGSAEVIELARSSGFERLDDAAVAAVRRWRFAPAKQAGRAVMAWVLVPLTFALQS